MGYLMDHAYVLTGERSGRVRARAGLVFLAMEETDYRLF
jgi:hypothetical protein